MFRTFKLCNMRDCHAHDVEPVPFDAINPCEVFWHEDSHMWYYEQTGSVVPMFICGDGTMFDVQAWLSTQAQDAMGVWTPKLKVHTKYERHVIKMRPSKPAARPPKYSCEELDGISDNFIRNRKGNANITSEIYHAGKKLQGLSRMQRKWNNNSFLDGHIQEAREELKALRTVKSEIDTQSSTARKHIKSENEWTNRWASTHGLWSDFVLLWEDPKTQGVWVIDRNGLKLNGCYVFIPDIDKAFINCANYAEKQYGIKKSEWKKFLVPAEEIGASLRRYGKKNANGRRINARYEQNKYAETCKALVKQLRQMGVNVRKFGRDDELYEYYLENIAPKIK